MAKAMSLEDMFLEELRDVYDAEKQLVRALPKMVEASSSDELRQALEEHLEETKNQVSRLEQIFNEELDEKPKAVKCAGMRGIIEEGEDVLDKGEEGPVLDACIIAAGQRVEHYEIAAYGTLRAWAEQLGHTRAVRLLEETLNEEKQADQKLNDIAENSVNAEAMQGAQSGEEGEAAEEREQRTSRRSSTRGKTRKVA